MDDHSWLADKLGEYDTVLAADGGLAHCRKAGVIPELVLGDMDSLSGETSVKKMTFPADKDASDMELAVDHAIQHGFDEVDVYGALGGRIDHQLCNIMVCARHPGRVRIIDRYCVIMSIGAGQETRRNGREGDIITLTSLADTARCSTKGLRYPLNDEILERGSRGLSNIMEGNTFEVTVSSGTVLIMHLTREG